MVERIKTKKQRLEEKDIHLNVSLGTHLLLNPKFNPSNLGLLTNSREFKRQMQKLEKSKDD